MIAPFNSLPSKPSFSEKSSDESPSPSSTENSTSEVCVELEELESKPSEVETKNKIPVLLEWNDISHVVKTRNWRFKTKEKQILHSVSGYCAPGHTVAVMGSSGAGKSTLMSILSNRTQNFEGEILINSVERKKSFRSLSAFVMQDDILLGNLTVRETLLYSALFRLPSKISYGDKKKRVDQVIAELGLTHVADSKIGIPGLVRGISGGERKRVNIGVELIPNPSVLLLDEPTSGLDAKTSLDVMRTVTNLANDNRSVICTIHQPRSNIFEMFDKLMLMARGRVAYFGDAQDAINYFANLGFQCPTHYNPADYFIDLVTESSAPESQVSDSQDEERIEYILDSFEKVAPEKTAVPEKIRQEDPPELRKMHRYKVSRVWQTFYIFLRSIQNNIRDKKATKARLVTNVVLSLIIGLVYRPLGYNQSSVHEREGCLFFLVLNTCLMSVQAVLATFQTEKPIFLKERGSSVYSVASYFIGRNLAEIPQQFFFASVFLTFAYWIAGLNATPDRYFLALLTVNVLAFTATSMGILMSTAFPTAQVANILSPLIKVVLILFGGFYVNLNDIPKYIGWIENLSFFKHGYEALLLIEFPGLKFTCTEEERTVEGSCPVPNGQSVLNSYQLEEWMIWKNIGIMIGMGFAMRLLAYLCLRYLRKPKE